MLDDAKTLLRLIHPWSISIVIPTINASVSVRRSCAFSWLCLVMRAGRSAEHEYDSRLQYKPSRTVFRGSTGLLYLTRAVVCDIAFSCLC